MTWEDRHFSIRRLLGLCWCKILSQTPDISSAVLAAAAAAFTGAHLH
jgi:hypothetical protein